MTFLLILIKLTIFLIFSFYKLYYNYFCLFNIIFYFLIFKNTIYFYWRNRMLTVRIVRLKSWFVTKFGETFVLDILGVRVKVERLITWLGKGEVKRRKTRLKRKNNEEAMVEKLKVQLQVFISIYSFRARDDNGAGRGRVSLSHTHSRKKNSSTFPYPNPTGIKLLSHPHPHLVTGIISYPYTYPFSYYFNINFN